MSGTTYELARVSPKLMGVHVQANTYKRLEVVTSGRSSYMAKKDVPANTAITDTTYWLKIAEGGVDAPQVQIQYSPNGTSDWGSTIGQDWESVYVHFSVDGGETWGGAINVTATFDATDCVTYSAQTKTDEQKTQARTNIDAAGIAEVAAALTQKANVDGYYSQLTAGAAENLVGGNDTSREFTRDTAGGTADIADGIVQIDRIKGNTIVWNQKISYGNFNSIGNWSSTKGTLSVANNVCTAVFNATQYNRDIRKSNIAFTATHKYLVSCDYNPDINCNVTIQLGSETGRVQITKSIVANKWTTVNAITGINRSLTGAYFGLDSLSDYSVKHTVKFRNVILIDLTQMFGAGNEPSTVAEFKKMFPLDYYNYNAGQLLSLNPTGILTDGFNQYNHNDPHINVFAQAYYIGGTYTSLWFSKSKTDTAIAYAFGDALTAGSFYTNGSTHYKANASVAAYDNSKTYAVGAYCIESLVVYKCNTAIDTAEAFDASKWTSLVDVAGMVTDGILTSVEITPVNHLFTPTEQGYVHVVGGNATNTVINLHWSGKRDGEYEPYWQSTRNIPIANINTDGTITESATGKTRLFPDGLCCADSVYDEVTTAKAIKRIGKVDLGSLNWNYYPASSSYPFGYFLSTNTDIIFKHSGSAITINHTSQNSSFSFDKDKSILLGTNNNLYIIDSSYTDAATFKAAMSGVYLYCELAVPIEVEFSVPLNLNYKVSDFGTETLLPINTATPVTTPIRLDVVYGLNVVDFVRNADKNFVTIEDGAGDNGSTFTNLRSALSTAFAIDIVPTYDATNKRYTFAITDNRKVEVPESATASGLKGTWAEDETAMYFCTDTDTWVKISKTTWE